MPQIVGPPPLFVATSYGRYVPAREEETPDVVRDWYGRAWTMDARGLPDQRVPELDEEGTR